ncbi:hypothetical protein ACFQV4_27575 [Streptomyces thermocarboxydus]
MHAPVQDDLFGAVEIELDHEGGTPRVSGGELPTVEIRRGPDTAQLETCAPRRAVWVRLRGVEGVRGDWTSLDRRHVQGKTLGHV